MHLATSDILFHLVEARIEVPFLKWYVLSNFINKLLLIPNNGIIS